ncbi:MAG: fructosamine kinase family protein [Raineya sp.]
MFGFEPNEFLEAVLLLSLGKSPKIEFFQAVSGGNINNAAKLATSEGVFFLKWNENAPDDAFELEAKGLEILQKKGMDTPYVLAYGKRQGKNFLLLEYHQGLEKPKYWAKLGRNLARMHQEKQDFFGLEYDNYLGTLTQTNQPEQDGIKFFIEKRLKVQAGLAFYNGLIEQHTLDSLQKLYEKLPDILPQELPALLHGDLWSGNVIVSNAGLPMLIDPAIYYGLREAEIAFTKLFGSFDEDFYESYQYYYPLLPDFEKRVPIYNLYPLLVHLNLFGLSYLPAIQRTIKQFLA